MDRSNSRDRQLRERAEAVIPGGMYGHQAVGLLPDDYPQFFETQVDLEKSVIDLRTPLGPVKMTFTDEAEDAKPEKK